MHQLEAAVEVALEQRVQAQQHLLQEMAEQDIFLALTEHQHIILVVVLEEELAQQQAALVVVVQGLTQLQVQQELPTLVAAVEVEETDYKVATEAVE